MPLRHWKLSHRIKIGEVEHLHELKTLGLEILQQMPGPQTMICGPISTGTLSIKENIANLKKAIMWHVQNGFHVFNQFPFEELMKKKDEEWKQQNGAQAYCNPIMDEVYIPIISSGYLKNLRFIPGWETSTGATIEHAVGKKAGVEITLLDKKWLEEIKNVKVNTIDFTIKVRD